MKTTITAALTMLLALASIAAPPDVILLSRYPSASDGAPFVQWASPKARVPVAPIFSGAWSGLNLASFDPTRIADGDVDTEAFEFVATGAPAWLTLDAGTPHHVRGLAWYSPNSPQSLGFLNNDPGATYTMCPGVVQFSDDAVAWTSAVEYSTQLLGSANRIYRGVTDWSDAGSHRYWRVGRPQTTLAPRAVITEIQWFEYGDDAAIDHYNVYDARNGARTLFASIPASRFPSESSPGDVPGLSVKPIADGSLYPGYLAASIIVTAVGTDGSESTGLPLQATIKDLVPKRRAAGH